MTIRRVTAILTATIVLLVANTAAAGSLDDALSSLFEGGELTERHGSAALLTRVGATYDGYAFVERLPHPEAYLVEIRLRWQDETLRFPVKMRRTGEGWRVDWVPDRAYTKALVSLLDSGELVALSDVAGDGWAETGTMPALPVVLTARRAVTPFGAVPFADRDELQPSKPFGRHVGRWVSEVLDDDPAPAGLAILAHESTPWSRLSRILLTAAGAGFFRLHLVAQTDAGLIAQPALAPVFQAGDQPSRKTSLIVAMADDSGTRFRISVGDRLIAAPDGCDGEVSLCLKDGEALTRRLGERIDAAFPDGPPNVSHVLFAADGPTPLQAALERAIDVPGALGIPPRKLYLGHTQ